MPRKKTAKVNKKEQILNLTKLEKRQLILDEKTVAKLEAFLLRSGGSKSELTISDALTHLLLEKGPNGIKFKPEETKEIQVDISLPSAAWNIADKSAEKSATDLKNVIEKLTENL
jgi:hypothetical protein